MPHIPSFDHLRSVSFLGKAALGAAFALGVLAVVPVSGCSSKTEATTALVNCTPGRASFCRCQDEAVGEKVCNDDGHSWSRCDPCETPGNPVLPDNPDQPQPTVDAGPKCGDSIVQDGEDCDDGNTNDNDGCNGDCHLQGADPLASRSCPGLDVHVWSAATSYSGSTLGSTNSGKTTPICTSTAGGPGSSGSAAADRVFKVTAHKSGTMTVKTSETSYDSLLYATTSCTSDSKGIPLLACADDVDGLAGETLSFPVKAGSVYSVFVDGSGVSQNEGPFKVTFSIK